LTPGTVLSRPLPKIISPVAVALLLLLVCALRPSRATALDNGLALTPPMGWNSWYGMSCDVSEAAIEQTAYQLVTSGLRDAGYDFVNLDDCWQGDRAPDGTITADPKRFTDGIQTVVSYVHSLGLKFGLYTDAGSKTCMGRPGSLGHEQQDAETYARWGVDFVKVDWCFSDGLDAPTQYQAIRDALQRAGTAAGHPMVFSICNWGVDAPWSWGPSTGNLWRTGGDIGLDPRHEWQHVLANIDLNAGHAAAARPGGWNDPDALQLGLGHMSEVEERSQVSIWAIMAAPLLLSNDPSNMSQYERETITNHDVIAIDQDPAGIQGTVVTQDDSGNLQVWAKPLQGQNSWAVALFNRSDQPAEMRVNFSDLGLKAPDAGVRDIWDWAPAQTVSGGYSATVDPHGTVLLKVEGRR
jgi:alpha-galactosidase